MGQWPESWFEKKKVEIEKYDRNLVRFWCEFIDGLMDVVTEDGCVDFTDPECIDAYVGPPYALVRLNVQNGDIRIDCATQEYPPKTIYEGRTLRIKGTQGDLSEWGVNELMLPRDCGVFLGKSLFEFRKQN
jgi:hypothetical protein